ncbi:MAG: hypothetical protein N2691_00770 [Patescibacteria group bacterium]|nr:hypothetical protein [Patescibacteria group bacterium]
MDKNILQSLIKHQADVQAHLSKNPQDLWMVVNPLFAPYFHAKVFIESNYKGGTQQLLRDAAVALADKNTGIYSSLPSASGHSSFLQKVS